MSFLTAFVLTLSLVAGTHWNGSHWNGAQPGGASQVVAAQAAGQ